MSETSAAPATTRHVVIIPNFRPASTNELLASVKARIHLKKRDREMVVGYCRLAGIPRATGKRRVSLVVTLEPDGREGDPDNFWKSTLDALKHARMLIDDKARWCEVGSVEFARGAGLATTIMLEDV